MPIRKKKKPNDKRKVVVVLEADVYKALRIHLVTNDMTLSDFCPQLFRERLLPGSVSPKAAS